MSSLVTRHGRHRLPQVPRLSWRVPLQRNQALTRIRDGLPVVICNAPFLGDMQAQARTERTAVPGPPETSSAKTSTAVVARFLVVLSGRPPPAPSTHIAARRPQAWRPGHVELRSPGAASRRPPVCHLPLLLAAAHAVAAQPPVLGWQLWTWRLCRLWDRPASLLPAPTPNPGPGCLAEEALAVPHQRVGQTALHPVPPRAQQLRDLLPHTGARGRSSPRQVMQSCGGTLPGGALSAWVDISINLQLNLGAPRACVRG